MGQSLCLLRRYSPVDHVYSGFSPGRLFKPSWITGRSPPRVEDILQQDTKIDGELSGTALGQQGLECVPLNTPQLVYILHFIKHMFMFLPQVHHHSPASLASARPRGHDRVPLLPQKAAHYQSLLSLGCLVSESNDPGSDVLRCRSSASHQELYHSAPTSEDLADYSQPSQNDTMRRKWLRHQYAPAWHQGPQVEVWPAVTYGPLCPAAPSMTSAL